MKGTAKKMMMTKKNNFGREISLPFIFHLKKSFRENLPHSFFYEKYLEKIQKVIDKIIILCYNVFEVKGKAIRTLTKNEKKY